MLDFHVSVNLVYVKVVFHCAFCFPSSLRLNVFTYTYLPFICHLLNVFTYTYLPFICILIWNLPPCPVFYFCFLFFLLIVGSLFFFFFNSFFPIFCLYHMYFESFLVYILPFYLVYLLGIKNLNIINLSICLYFSHCVYMYVLNPFLFWDHIFLLFLLLVVFLTFMFLVHLELR